MAAEHKRGESPAIARPGSALATPQLSPSDAAVDERADDQQAIIDTLILVADFLERSTALKETARTLRSEASRVGIVPRTIGWDGTERAASLPDFRSLRKLPPDHLLRVLKSVRPPNSLVASVLPTRHDLLSSTLDLIVTRKSVGVRSPSESGEASRRLADLRLEQRQLAREMKSERGRSRPSLNETLLAVTAKASNLSRTLYFAPRTRKLSAQNIVDHLESLVQSIDSRPASRALVSHMRILKKITGHRAPAYCCSSTHTKWIFTAADDNVVKLWNGETAQLHYAFRGHTNVITDLSCTEELIASASEDNDVRLWEIGSTKPWVVFRHKQPVQRVQFSPDGKWLFTSAEDGACCVWNIELLRIQANDRDVSAKAWIERERERRRHEALNRAQTGAGTPLLAPQQEELQMLLDCPRQALVPDPPLLFPHCDKSGVITKIVCMAVHPSGKFVATGSEDRLGRVWSVDEVPSPTEGESTIAPEGLIDGVYRDGAKHLLCTLSGHTEGFVHHIEWSHKGDRILTFSDKDGTARIWFWPLGDFASKPQQLALKAVASSSNVAGRAPRASSRNVPMIDGAGFSRDDSFVLTTQSIKPSSYKDEEPGFWDSRVCVWDSKSGTLLRFIRGHRAQAHIVRMHPEFNWAAATCGADGLIIFWDIDKGEEIHRLEAISTEGYPSILDARWSPNQNHPGDFIATDSMGRLLIVGTGDNGCYSAAPCEQFFSNERDNCILDPSTKEPLDAALQIPLSMMAPQPFLVDVYEERYAHQPPPVQSGEGSLLGGRRAAQTATHQQLVGQATEKQRLVSLKENLVLQDRKFRDIIQKQDDAVLQEMQKDLEEHQETQGGNRPSAASKPKVLRTRIQQSRPMLALERAILEDGDTSSSEASEVEEEEEEDDDEEEPTASSTGGRQRRAAARRANTRIHRHVRHLIDSEPVSRTENDPTFVEGSARRRRRDDDDEEDELSDEESDEESLDEDWRARLPRKVYETRGRRQNYAHLDEDGDDAEQQEDDDDDDDERPRRPRRKHIPSTRVGEPRSAVGSATTTNGMAPPVDFSNEWLLSVTETTSYVPQCGDQVVYFPQGHAEYLRHFPSTESPPWQAWDGKTWPYVKCKVTDVEHVFPEKDEPRQILCKVHLKVVEVKTHFGSKDPFEPVPDTLPELSFSVLYHSFEMEFLVLLERFLAGLRPTFTVGSRVRCLVRGGMAPHESTECQAVIKQIRVKDPENWPDSPWEALVCETSDPVVGQDSQILVSPWDVDVDPQHETPPWRMISDETRDFRETEVKEHPAQQWIADEIDSCALWSAFFRVRRNQSLPCPISISLVSERLRDEHYYRQWDAIAWDFRKVTESATFGKWDKHPMRRKAERFLLELTEILFTAQHSGQQEMASTSFIPADALKAIVSEELDKVAVADKEGFFAEPVNLEELPDYLDHVSQPMDFSTIRHNIKSETFRGSLEVSFPRARQFIRNVVRDVRLIAANAMTYNPEGTVAFRRARDVLKKMSQVFSALDLDEIDLSRFKRRPTRSRPTLDDQAEPTEEEEATQMHFTSRGRRVRATISSYDPVAEAVPDSLLDESEEEEEDFSSDDDDVGRRKKKKGSRRSTLHGVKRHNTSGRLSGYNQSRGMPQQEPHGVQDLQDQPYSPIPVHRDPTSTQTTTRVKRLRISIAEPASFQTTDGSPAAQPFVKRGRGRPRKYPLPSETLAVVSSGHRPVLQQPLVQAAVIDRPRRAAAQARSYQEEDEEPYGVQEPEMSKGTLPRSNRSAAEASTSADMTVSGRPSRRVKQIKFNFAENDGDAEEEAEEDDEAISSDDWSDEGRRGRRQTGRSRRRG